MHCANDIRSRETIVGLSVKYYSQAAVNVPSVFGGRQYRLGLANYPRTHLQSLPLRVAGSRTALLDSARKTVNKPNRGSL
jgi:hypothetical protein